MPTRIILVLMLSLLVLPAFAQWEEWDDKDLALFREDQKEIDQLRTMADQGHAGAQYNLGLKYDAGRGVPRDYWHAARWYRLAADQGHAAAQYNLGSRYLVGEGVPQDDKEAVRWYRLAADQGHAGAQYNLGVMYDNGRGVPQDDEEAFRRLRLARDQGLAQAQNNSEDDSFLGTFLIYGFGRVFLIVMAATTFLGVLKWMFKKFRKRLEVESE